MAVFDEYIEKVNEYVKNLRDNITDIKEFDCPDSIEEIKEGLPIKIGPKANPRIILRGETHMELGNPLDGSSSIFLWTDDTSKLNHGKITLFGPDITDAKNGNLPFGQIFLVGGKKLPDLEHNNLVHHQRVSDEIEGFMLKSSPDHDTWCRISKDAAKKGFSFEMLGKALMAIYRSRVPEAEAIEIAFITSNKEDVNALNKIARKAKEISSEIVKEAWKAKGYDLDCDYDCSSCGDSNVCDDVRELVAKRAERLERKYIKRKQAEEQNES